MRDLLWQTALQRIEMLMVEEFFRQLNLTRYALKKFILMRTAAKSSDPLSNWLIAKLCYHRFTGHQILLPNSKILDCLGDSINYVFTKVPNYPNIIIGGDFIRLLHQAPGPGQTAQKLAVM